jgi:uncharacterized iron-regulated membrane protein
MMKWLSILHRWTGAFIGLLLALIGLSGAILLWEGEWINLPGASDPLAENAVQIAAITDRAIAQGGLSRITFASDEIGLHLVVRDGGGGAYLSQQGLAVDQWSSQWQRPELWLFDFHHHLFSGETGETITGLAGLAGMLFVVTGLVLWWRSRRTFRIRLWPQLMAPGPVVKHHRDLGVVAAPLLLVSMLTGTMMLFEPIRSALIGKEERPKVEQRWARQPTAGEALLFAKARFPDAALRRITMPHEPGGAIGVRMKRPFEWTPNGRTQLTFAVDGTLIIQDAAAANRSATLNEKLYPVHTAKVGGLLWKLAMTASGLALAMLGLFAFWSFWRRKTDHLASRRRRRHHAARPAQAETANWRRA